MTMQMLRVYFLHHRELLGALSLAAYQTVKELMAAAVAEEKGFRPGMVSVVQTFGERATFHPHVHALVSRGGWTASGQWILVQIPDPRRQLVLYYGAYSNAARGKLKKATAPAETSHQPPEDAAVPDGPSRAALRRRWAELIRRVYEVDPLVCPRMWQRDAGDRLHHTA